MFFKTKKIEETAADQERRGIYNELLDSSSRVSNATRLIVIKQGVANLYPSGADKDAAEAEVAKAQRELICAIAGFDSKRQEYNDYVKTHAGEFSNTYQWPSQYRWTSHDIIENTYREMMIK